MNIKNWSILEYRNKEFKNGKFIILSIPKRMYPVVKNYCRDSCGTGYNFECYKEKHHIPGIDIDGSFSPCYDAYGITNSKPASTSDILLIASRCKDEEIRKILKRKLKEITK